MNELRIVLKMLKPIYGVNPAKTINDLQSQKSFWEAGETYSTNW